MTVNTISRNLLLFCCIFSIFALGNNSLAICHDIHAFSSATHFQLAACDLPSPYRERDIIPIIAPERQDSGHLCAGCLDVVLSFLPNIENSDTKRTITLLSRCSYYSSGLFGQQSYKSTDMWNSKSPLRPHLTLLSLRTVILLC